MLNKTNDLEISDINHKSQNLRFGSDKNRQFI